MSENPGFWERLAALNPAVVRAVVVAIVGVVALVAGKAIDDGTVDVIVNVLMVILPIVAGFFIKRAVTPNAKVVVLKPDPVNAPDVVAPGEATTGPEQGTAVLEAAIQTPQAA